MSEVSTQPDYALLVEGSVPNDLVVLVPPAASPDVPPSFWVLGQGAREPDSETIRSPSSVDRVTKSDFSESMLESIIDNIGVNAVRIIRVMMVIDFTAVPLRAVMLLRGHTSI